MQSVSSILHRAAAILALIALLLVPVAACASDPLIQPPLPHAIARPQPPGFWHLLLAVWLT